MGPVHCNKRKQHENAGEVLLPNSNDVVCGKGGLAINHIGNKNFRDIVAKNQPKYKTLSKQAKTKMSRMIVNQIRKLDPPGRFLKKDPRTNLWFDVGDKVARRKTSQALRENVRTVHEKPTVPTTQIASVTSATLSPPNAASDTTTSTFSNHSAASTSMNSFTLNVNSPRHNNGNTTFMSTKAVESNLIEQLHNLNSTDVVGGLSTSTDCTGTLSMFGRDSQVDCPQVNINGIDQESKTTTGSQQRLDKQPDQHHCADHSQQGHSQHEQQEQEKKKRQKQHQQNEQWKRQELQEHQNQESRIFSFFVNGDSETAYAVDGMDKSFLKQMRLFDDEMRQEKCPPKIQLDLRQKQEKSIQMHQLGAYMNSASATPVPAPPFDQPQTPNLKASSLDNAANGTAPAVNIVMNKLGATGDECHAIAPTSCCCSDSSLLESFHLDMKTQGNNYNQCCGCCRRQRQQLHFCSSATENKISYDIPNANCLVTNDDCNSSSNNNNGNNNNNIILLSDSLPSHIKQWSSTTDNNVDSMSCCSGLSIPSLSITSSILSSSSAPLNCASSDSGSPSMSYLYCGSTSSLSGNDLPPSALTSLRKPMPLNSTTSNNNHNENGNSTAATGCEGGSISLRPSCFCSSTTTTKYQDVVCGTCSVSDKEINTTVVAPCLCANSNNDAVIADHSISFCDTFDSSSWCCIPDGIDFAAATTGVSSEAVAPLCGANNDEILNSTDTLIPPPIPSFIDIPEDKSYDDLFLLYIQLNNGHAPVA